MDLIEELRPRLG